jgi:hypothetical protein
MFTLFSSLLLVVAEVEKAMAIILVELVEVVVVPYHIQIMSQLYLETQ